MLLQTKWENMKPREGKHETHEPMAAVERFLQLRAASGQNKRVLRPGFESPHS